MKTWFDEPEELLNIEKVSEFWPTGEQTPEDRVNATSRFVIYTTCILYLTRRDPKSVRTRVATVLSVIYVLIHIQDGQREGYGGDRQTLVRSVIIQPVKTTPWQMYLITDYTDAPNRLEACYYSNVKPNDGCDRIPYDGGTISHPLMPKYQRNGLDRQFISNPVTKIPGDQTAFAEWLYGPKNGPTCKSNDTRLCATPICEGGSVGGFRRDR